MADQPLTFIPDTIQDSGIDVGVVQSTKVRGGLVVGLTGSAETALDQILTATGMPLLGSTLVLNGKALYLQNIRAKAIETDSARVQLVYSNDFQSGQSSAYVISYRGYLQAYTNNRLPGTRIPLVIPKWVDPNNKFNKVRQDIAMGTFEYSMREVSVRGIKFGAAPAPGTYDGYSGYANDQMWLNKPTGYWKINSGSEDVSKYSGFYSYSISATTKNLEDWSELFTLYNRQTNQYVTLRPADELAMQNTPYSPGIMVQVQGGLRIGPCPVTNFTALFGF
jgi:hypothetical protein